MSNWKCTLCPYEIGSFAELKGHYLEIHNMYLGKPEDKLQDPELLDLTVQTLDSFRTTKAQVKYLLEKFPETRGDDRILILKHLQYFQHCLAYDPTTQLISFRNKDGITYEWFRRLTSFETITRVRRKLQSQFAELQASTIVQLKRERKEEVIRKNMKYL